MILIFKFDLDMIKVHLPTKMKFLAIVVQKFGVWTDKNTLTQTDQHTDRLKWNYYLSEYMDGKNSSKIITYLHMWMVRSPVQNTSAITR